MFIVHKLLDLSQDDSTPREALPVCDLAVGICSAGQVHFVPEGSNNGIFSEVEEVGGSGVAAHAGSDVGE